MQIKTFGEWLRHQRLQKEISPFHMAEALGYKRVSAIYNFEYGIAPLPLSKWPLMAEILGLSVAAFLETMDRYAPEKAAEFRRIRESAAPEDVSDSGKGSRRAQEHSAVIVPTAARVSEDRLKSFHLTDAEIVFVTHEPWEDSLILAVDRVRRGKGLRPGLLQVIGDSPLPSVAIVTALREAQTVCVLEPENAGMPHPMADQVKAAFLDALTGAEGYPQIHRVPRIFSVAAPARFDGWSAAEIQDILARIRESGRRRHLLLKVAGNIPSPAINR